MVKAPFEFEDFADGKGARMLAVHGSVMGVLGFCMPVTDEGYTLCTTALAPRWGGAVKGYKHVTVFNKPSRSKKSTTKNQYY